MMLTCFFFFSLSPNHSERANLNHHLTFRGCLRAGAEGQPTACTIRCLFAGFFPFVRDESRVVTAKSE